MHQIGVREVVHVAGLTFNSETLIMTWITMAIVLLIAYFATRNLSVDRPTGCQNVVEIIVEMLHGQMDAMMGVSGRNILAPFVICLFMFILISNWLGLVPKMASPTNDMNTTLGLAASVVLMIHFTGLRVKGLKHFKKFVEPFPVFLPINLIEEVAKPITLAFRLFGNILAGEILIIILLKLIPWWMPIPSVCWLAFSIFVGGVQAFIFTLLSVTYLSESVEE